MMGNKRILLMYVSKNSGHHRASLALESALRALDPEVEILNINSVKYTNPVLGKIIKRTYLEIIKRTPEVWEYLYDNPRILAKTQRLRKVIHKYNSGKLKTLLDSFNPHAVACTQAFPCGMVADYKKSFNIKIPLIGILTDYAPHSYWIYDDVDMYVVPSPDTGRRLIENGVDPARIQPLGIPVDPSFIKSVKKSDLFESYGLDNALPVVLLMGGGLGLGPMRKMIAKLERSELNIQLMVIAGRNKALFRWCKRRQRKAKKKMLVFPYSNEIDKLMAISTVVITKAGGLTASEALAKRVPMILLSPLPGQETMNTKFLIDNRLAVRADSSTEALVLLEELFYNPTKLRQMRRAAGIHGKPDAARKIAEMLLGMC